MRLARILPHVLVIAAMVLLVACAQVPAGGAATFNDNAVATLQGTDAVVKVATTLLVARKITPDDADSIAKMADAVRVGVQVAKSAEKQSPGTGTARLRAASAALDELNRYLATKKGG